MSWDREGAVDVSADREAAIREASKVERRLRAQVDHHAEGWRTEARLRQEAEAELAAARERERTLREALRDLTDACKARRDELEGLHGFDSWERFDLSLARAVAAAEERA